VILSKQLMWRLSSASSTGQTSRGRLEREQILQEMTRRPRNRLRAHRLRRTFRIQLSRSGSQADAAGGADGFIHSPDAPASGDELTFLVAREVLQRIAPAMLMINFSDMEVAAFRQLLAAPGRDYTRRRDLSPDVAVHSDHSRSGDNTTLIIMKRIRSATGRLLHQRILQPPHRHRVLPHGLDHGAGPAAGKPAVVEREIRQLDVTPPSLPGWGSNPVMARARGSRNSMPEEPRLPAELVRRLPHTSARRSTISSASGTSSFPAEQPPLRAQLDWLSGLEPAGLDRLFAPLVELEGRMALGLGDAANGLGVREVGILARSPLYPQWRVAVEKVFSRIDDASAPSIPLRNSPAC